MGRIPHAALSQQVLHIEYSPHPPSPERAHSVRRNTYSKPYPDIHHEGEGGLDRKR